MAKLTILTPIKGKLKTILTCQVYGQPCQKVKPRGIFKYLGHTFFTAKDGKYWYCYEFKSGLSAVSYSTSEEEAIRQTKHKVDIYCKNRTGLYMLVSSAIMQNGFSPHAKYSNLIPAIN